MFTGYNKIDFCLFVYLFHTRWTLFFFFLHSRRLLCMYIILWGDFFVAFVLLCVKSTAKFMFFFFWNNLLETFIVFGQSTISKAMQIKMLAIYWKIYKTKKKQNYALSLIKPFGWFCWGKKSICRCVRLFSIHFFFRLFQVVY